MLQDSLHHTTAPAAEPYDFEASGAETEAASPSARWHHRIVAVADTTPPDPKQMKPLAPGQALTMKPQLMDEDYWSNGLIRFEKSQLLQELDSVTGMELTTTTLNLSGKAGDPIPYRFRTDNFVTIVLLLSFFLVVWVISRSRTFLEHSAKDFFHPRQRENLFAERTENELRGQLFLVFQTCFVLAVLFFDCTQELQQEVFNQVSPYKLLGVSTFGFCIYYGLKVGLYNFVNAVFFNREQQKQWAEAYMLTVLALGVSLFPVALLVVYFDLSFTHLIWVTAILYAVDKLLLIYKAYHIFFHYPFGWVHLILYFCTLEVTPALILWRALTYINNILLTVN